MVRDVLSYQEDSTLASLWFKDISIPARTTELYACAKIVDNLRNEASEPVSYTHLDVYKRQYISC